ISSTAQKESVLSTSIGALDSVPCSWAAVENNRRAGTENAASIIGFGKAAEIARAKMREEQVRVRRMRDRFERCLLERISGARVNGAGAERLPNTSSVMFDGIESDAALLMLDQKNLCCSAGS